GAQCGSAVPFGRTEGADGRGGAAFADGAGDTADGDIADAGGDAVGADGRGGIAGGDGAGTHRGGGELRCLAAGTDGGRVVVPGVAVGAGGHAAFAFGQGVVAVGAVGSGLEMARGLGGVFAGLCRHGIELGLVDGVVCILSVGHVDDAAFAVDGTHGHRVGLVRDRSAAQCDAVFGSGKAGEAEGAGAEGRGHGLVADGGGVFADGGG